jgi:hypothetical protein
MLQRYKLAETTTELQLALPLLKPAVTSSAVHEQCTKHKRIHPDSFEVNCSDSP